MTGRLADSSETPRCETQFVPLLYQQFDATPSARPAFFRLNEDLLPTIRSRNKRLPQLRDFRRPVRIIFGDSDPYLNEGVARRFHELFPQSELFLLPGARHFVQMDEPEQVARLILALPHAVASGRTPGTESVIWQRRMADGPPRTTVYFDPLRELLIVGGRAVDSWNRAVVQPQIHRQLAAMVREVVERIAQHDMPRLIQHDLPACE